MMSVAKNSVMKMLVTILKCVKGKMQENEESPKLTIHFKPW